MEAAARNPDLCFRAWWLRDEDPVDSYARGCNSNHTRGHCIATFPKGSMYPYSICLDPKVPI